MTAINPLATAATPPDRIDRSLRRQDQAWYPLYQWLRHPGTALRRRAERAFYASLLTRDARPQLIFDVGANVGHKSAIFLRFAERVVAVEPDPDAVRRLRRRFAERPGIAIESSAVADRTGLATFFRLAAA